jgi:hypothetical protein
MAWFRQVWESWLHDRSDADGPDIDRIWEMLEYLRDVPYVAASGRPVR